MKIMNMAQKGVGMMEVLVAMVILSIAILGFVALQVRATAATDEALNRSDSLVILNGLAEKIRINSTGNYKASIPNSAPPCIASKNCSSDNQALADLYNQKQFADTKGISLAVTNCVNTSSQQTRLCLIAAWGVTTATIAADTVENRCLNSSDGKYALDSHCLVLEAY